MTGFDLGVVKDIIDQSKQVMAGLINVISINADRIQRFTH